MSKRKALDTNLPSKKKPKLHHVDRYTLLPDAFEKQAIENAKKEKESQFYNKNWLVRAFEQQTKRDEIKIAQRNQALLTRALAKQAALEEQQKQNESHGFSEQQLKKLEEQQQLEEQRQKN